MFATCSASMGRAWEILDLLPSFSIGKEYSLFRAEDNDEETLFELVAEAGAEDLTVEDDGFEVTTPVEAFGSVQAALDEAGIKTMEAGLQRVPTTTTRLDAEAAKSVMKLIDHLEELQDVQAVYSTLEMDDATIAAIS